MEENLFSINEPVTFSTRMEESMEYMTDEELIMNVQEQEEISGSVSSGDATSVADDLPEAGNEAETESEVVSTVAVPVSDVLTNEVYMDGVSQLISVIDEESVHEEILYVDRGTVYNTGSELPDYAVVYECNGVEVVFPTDYAEDIFVADGMLVNLGNSYTAGLQVDGYSVDNYLSSEITIPTYHSATWYQYQQSYGQPYRIVDRYVNNYGNISSSTRNSVSVEWTGGKPWEGFTFDRASMFIVIVVLLIMLVFRKGNK